MNRIILKNYRSGATLTSTERGAVVAFMLVAIICGLIVLKSCQSMIRWNINAGNCSERQNVNGEYGS